MKRFKFAKFLTAVIVAASTGWVSAQGTWAISVPADPATAWVKNGTVIQAANLGPASGGTINIQPVNVAGIAFGTNVSSVAPYGAAGQGAAGSGTVPANPPVTDYFYSGPDAAVSNLVNTWYDLHTWDGGGVHFVFSGLTAGHAYQFQCLMGFAWGGCALNMYGVNAEYQYMDSTSTGLGMATYTWTASVADATIDIEINYDAWGAIAKEVTLSAYSLIDTSAAPLTISSPQALAGGKLKFTINSAPNTTVDVLVSSNLVQWTTNATVVNVSGADACTNTVAGARAYYRLLQH